MFLIFSQKCLEELAEEVSVLLAIIFANTQWSEKIPKNIFLACVFPKEKENLQNQKNFPKNAAILEEMF